MRPARQMRAVPVCAPAAGCAIACPRQL